MEIQFYTISEDMARAANDANSMSDYKQGSATEEYRKRVESVYAVVEKIKQKRPNLAEKAERMAGRYSKKLAEYYNSYYRNEASCPSVLISGAGNFPVKKKNKQNSRRDSLMQEWNSLESYAKKITNLLTMNQPILSGDAQAIEMLEEKLESLTELQDRMKAVNAYWRKHKTVEGCPELSVSQQEEFYTIKEKDKEVAGITVTYDDGSTKEIQQGCCVDLKNGSDDLSVELLNIKAFDLVKLTYGLMVVIEKIGLEDAFNAYARGETIQEAQDE